MSVCGTLEVVCEVLLVFKTDCRGHLFTDAAGCTKSFYEVTQTTGGIEVSDPSTILLEVDFEKLVDGLLVGGSMWDVVVGVCDWYGRCEASR